MRPPQRTDFRTCSHRRTRQQSQSLRARHQMLWQSEQSRTSRTRHVAAGQCTRSVRSSLGRPSTVSFQYITASTMRGHAFRCSTGSSPFLLPCRWCGVFAVLRIIFLLDEVVGSKCDVFTKSWDVIMCVLVLITFIFHSAVILLSCYLVTWICYSEKLVYFWYRKNWN